MNALPYPEMEITALVFDAALLFYLLWVGRRTGKVSGTFLRSLILLTASGVFTLCLHIAFGRMQGENANALFFILTNAITGLAVISLLFYGISRIRGTEERSLKLLAVVSAFLLTAAGFLLPYLTNLRIAACVSGASAGAFLLYFALETPPFMELRKRLSEVEEAGRRAEEERVRAQLEDLGMNEFLAHMSHEIRTPLTAILGYDEMLLRHAKKQEVREYAEDIGAFGNALLFTVGDILDFSKLENEALQLQPAVYRLKEMQKSLDAVFLRQARLKGIEYTRETAEDLPEELFGDGESLSRVILNLLNHALSRLKRGHVRLQLTQESGTVLCIRVRYGGERVFRIEKEADGDNEGLPASVTRALVRLMGGTLQETDSEGVLLARIPMVAARREKDNGLMLLSPRARLLITDDNKTNREVAAELLKPTLMHVDTAASGEECIALAKTNAYDIILLDQMMPHMSGPETLHRLDASGRGKNAAVRIIAFTADAVAGTRERLLAEGFDDYLEKPVTSDSLMRMLRNHLPKEKMIEPGERGFVPAYASSRKQSGAAGAKAHRQQVLAGLKGIDLQAALKVCGTREVLFAAVRDFYKSIPQQADLIERYMHDGDYPNYAIKLRALRISAGFVGAEALAEEARELEQAGIARDAGLIEEKTPRMLAHYRGFTEKLAAIEEA